MERSEGNHKTYTSPNTDKSSNSRFGRKITPKKPFDPSEELNSVIMKTSPMKNVSVAKFGSPVCRKREGKFKKTMEETDDCSTPGSKQLLLELSAGVNVTPNCVHDIKSPVKDLPSKTPYTLRQRLRTRIQCEVEKEEVLPFDASDDSEWDESENESSDSEEEEEEALALPLPSPKSLKPVISLKQSSHYVYSSSHYLDKSSGKSITSSHRLKVIEDLDEVNKLLASYVPTHFSQIALLNKHNKSMFYKWMYALSKGFNILVYGLGSKKKLLDQFRNNYLNVSKVLVINGYFPGLTMKEILSSFCELLGNKVKDSLEVVLHTLGKLKHHVFVVVHNIDGFSLRQDKIQMFLSQIASYSKVHLVVSIDHINAPLLWDQKKLSNFNFIWEECTTYLPYIMEKNFESSLIVRTSANMALSSLRNVFHSLNKNSRNIFKILMENSLNRENKNSGMQFSELYRLCRRNFIVSSDLALRTQLTEFIDHQLVRWKKETDMLIISVEPDVLKTFKSEIDIE